MLVNQQRPIIMADIRARLEAHRPDLLTVSENRHAAVAMVLREVDQQVEMLFIERAKRVEDPWSGQMALPGGMVEVVDSDARAAAERETAEEVGLRVDSYEYLGRLNDLQGRHAAQTIPIIISAFVYQSIRDRELVPNEEVQDVLWIPLSTLLNRQRYVDVCHPRAPNQVFTGIQVSDAEHQIVWGLTHRFLATFFKILELPFHV